MSTTTTNLGLTKHELTDAADITALNRNWDIIDEKITEQQEYNTQLYGTHNKDKLKTDIAHNMAIYTNLAQIGLTSGSETIEGIASKLPTYSRLVLTVGEGMNSNIYPDGNYGLLIVEKTVNSRVVFTFTNNQGKQWIMVYSHTTNGTDNTGWISVYNEQTKIILTRYMHYGNSLPSEGTAGQLFFLKL